LGTACAHAFVKNDNNIALVGIDLAQRDFEEKILVSQKLYDRFFELSYLLSTFERVSCRSFKLSSYKEIVALERPLRFMSNVTSHEEERPFRDWKK